MSFRVVIPARYASTRFPGKPLADLAGKPMIVRVVEAARASAATEVLVATDDERIAAAVVAHGHVAVLTRADHTSGTDRLAEVATARGWQDDDIVVNVQGDEPLIAPALIDAVAGALAADAAASIATAACPVRELAEFLDPNVVKVVTAADGHALYFSRAPIPWHRDGLAAHPDRLPNDLAARRHIGLYAYRVGFLRRYHALAPAPLEVWEALEQLRALWHGLRIRVIDWAAAPAPGVDTPADLERVRAHYAVAQQSGRLSRDR